MTFIKLAIDYVYFIEFFAILLMIFSLVNKRRVGLVKFLSIVVIFMIMIITTHVYGHMIFWQVCLVYLLSILVGGIAFYFSCDLSIKDCIYGTLCGYAIQHFTCSLYILICYLFKIDIRQTLWVNQNSIAVYLIVYIGIYLIFYQFLLKKLVYKGAFNVKFLQSIVVVFMVLTVAIFLSLAEKMYGNGGISFAISQIYAMICCLIILWMQYWQQKSMKLSIEVETHQQLSRLRKEQFLHSISSIDLINRKSHDLKYQIEQLKHFRDEAGLNQSIDEIKWGIQFYDTTFQTDNEALDTILMEKQLLSSQYQIQMTCMADGCQLNFMNPVDLYTLFGNILDNAIEASKLVENPDKRIIAIRIYTKNKMTMIQIDNYFDGHITFQGSLPVTRKRDKDNHGYGLKSVRHIVKQYNGTLSTEVKDRDVFSLSIVCPQRNRVDQ